MHIHIYTTHITLYDIILHMPIDEGAPAVRPHRHGLL